MQPYSKNLKELSQKLRSNQTDAERKLWQRINRDQLLGFRFNRQKPLLNYIVDFYCAKAKLIIELDGSHHYEPEYQEKDRQRDDELRSLGFTVMRFSNDEIYYEIEAVVEQIYLFLEQVQISPSPSLLKRGTS
ncbi:endonuclease domain-containing protein [Gallibacterium sp. ZY190522]